MLENKTRVGLGETYDLTLRPKEYCTGVLRLIIEKSPKFDTDTFGSKKKIQPSPRARRIRVGETDRVG